MFNPIRKFYSTDASCNYTSMNAHENPPNNTIVPYTLGQFLRVTIFEEGNPGNIFFTGETNLSFNTSLPAGEAQARGIVAALTALASIPPDAEGTWNGEANGVAIAPCTAWAWAVIAPGDPLGLYSLGVCFDQNTPAIFGTMPGDGTAIQMLVELLETDPIYAPVPFWQEIQDWIDGDGNGKFIMTALMYKPQE